MIHDSIAKLFVIVMIMLTMASNGIAMKVFAETATVYSEGSVIPTENIVELSLDTSTVTSDNIQRYNGEYSDYDVPSVPDMEEGKTYTAYYVKGLNYFGKQLTVKVDVTLADKAMTPSDGFNKVYIDSKGYIKVHWRYSYDVKVDWKITLLDPDTNAEYPIFVFMGIMDPDESNYYFDTTAVDLYYNEAGKGVASIYLVEPDGLYKAYREGDTYTKIDTKGKQPITPYRDDGKFFVSKDAKWSSFEFRTNTFHNGSLVVPYFYSYCYNVAFDANRPEGTTGEGTMDPQKGLEFETSYNLTKNAYTTEGYTFVGWNSKKDGTGTNFTDGQSFTDTVIKPDAPVAPGETVTIYAQWEMWKYWINYDPNGGKDPKDMPRQEFTYEDTKMESVLNKFTRDGYRFSGFLYTDKEGNSKLYKDIYDFVDILKGLGPNSEITLVAQWEKLPDPSTPYTAPKTGIE